MAGEEFGDRHAASAFGLEQGNVQGALSAGDEQALFIGAKDLPRDTTVGCGLCGPDLEQVRM